MIKTETDNVYSGLDTENLKEKLVYTKRLLTIEELKNKEFKKYETENYLLTQKNKKLEERIILVYKEKEEAINAKNLEIVELQRKIYELKLEMDNERIKHNAAQELYTQKLSMIQSLEKDNASYGKEVESLKSLNAQEKEHHLQELQTKEVENDLKHERLKKKLIEILKDAQNNIDKLNMNYMDVSSKLAFLHNNQLVTQIEFQMREILRLEKRNKELQKQMKDMKNEAKIHRNVELRLANKVMKITDNLSNMETIERKSINLKKKPNLHLSVSDKKIISNGNSTMNSSYFIDENNISKIYNNSSLNIYPFCINSGTSKLISRYEKESKYKDKIHEDLLIKFDELKRKVYTYESKYNGLFLFMEDCLEKFYKDIIITEHKTLNMHLEEIKRGNFNGFTLQEQYALLVLLMKNIMPLVSINFTSATNFGKNVFMTNLNLISKTFNKNKNYLCDHLLKNAFKNRNAKYKEDLLKSINYTENSNSIPVLRQSSVNKENGKIILKNY